MRDNTMQWDFWSLSPESLHQVTWLFGDRGIPATHRHMNGYGSHTFSLWNGNSERYWVKWHLKTMQGVQYLTADQAAGFTADDPDCHRRDLYEAVERGDYPKWRVMVQIMPEREAETYHLNPFDLTKVWPHRDYPLVEAGILELNRNPQNNFAEVEQAAFEPSNLPPGFGASPDKMLQARLMSYPDAHRYRIGINYGALAVNKPRCPVHSHHCDGHMRFDGNFGGTPNYEPNSFGEPTEDASYREPPLKVSSDADRYDHRAGNDDYIQAGNLYRLMGEDEKTRLVDNIVGAIKSVPREIQVRQVGHFHKADPDYGRRVAAGLGIDLREAISHAA
jgi:catalase